MLNTVSADFCLKNLLPGVTFQAQGCQKHFLVGLVWIEAENFVTFHRNHRHSHKYCTSVILLLTRCLMMLLEAVAETACYCFDASMLDV